MNKEEIEKYVREHVLDVVNRSVMLEMIERMPDVSEQDLRLLQSIKAATPKGYIAVGYMPDVSESDLKLLEQIKSATPEGYRAVEVIDRSATDVCIEVIIEKIHKEPELIWHSVASMPGNLAGRVNNNTAYLPKRKLAGHTVIYQTVEYDLILCEVAKTGCETVILGHWNDGPLTDGE